MERDELIIDIYLRIERLYAEIMANQRLRRGGFPPALSDPELLTMEVIAEIEGKNGDRAIWRYFKSHWCGWFPGLCAYKTFAKQSANLFLIRQEILARLFPAADVQIVDGVPLPICHNARAGRSRMLDAVATWGFCAAKGEHYYGLKGQIAITPRGVVSASTVVPANVDERQSLWDISSVINGLVIGDKGYISQDLQKELARHGINLQTPLRDNMTDPRPKEEVSALMKLRKRVETALSLLVGHFNLARIKAHDLWHYTSKFTRKLLAYNFYVEEREKS